MSPDWSQLTTRRRALQTIATAGIIGITGCTNNGNDAPETPSQPPWSTTHNYDRLKHKHTTPHYL